MASTSQLVTQSRKASNKRWVGKGVTKIRCQKTTTALQASALAGVEGGKSTQLNPKGRARFEPGAPKGKLAAQQA